MTATDLRNPGIALDASLLEHGRVTTPAAQRRAESLKARRSVKKQWQAAWLVKAITCIDLTTLAGDDTPQRVARLCAKARRPLRPDLVAGLGLEAAPPRGGAGPRVGEGGRPAAPGPRGRPGPGGGTAPRGCRLRVSEHGARRGARARR